MKSWLGAAMLLAAMAAIGCSDYDRAQKHYDAGEYDRALALWLPLADAGDARAQYAVGYIYDKGLGLPEPDWSEAARWYRLAAEQEHADAQYNLAILYHTPREGWKQDMVRAVSWYQKAAENGLAGAQFMVGRMYYRGTDLPKDHALAASWLQRCAEQHEPKCLNLLGILYREGHGVPEDRPRAMHLICQAAELGEPAAQVNLSTALMAGRDLPQDPVESARWRLLGSKEEAEVTTTRPDWAATLTDLDLERARALAGEWRVATSPEEARERCVAYEPE